MKKITKKKANENGVATGLITAKFYDQTSLTDKQKEENKVILSQRENNPAIMEKYNLGILVEEKVRHNVICNLGFNALIKRLVGDTTFTGKINKALLGDGSVSASASDDKMGNETYRNTMTSGTDSSNQVIMTAVFTENECSGTYTEFGNCIDGGEEKDTGRLWSHITGLNWVKDEMTVLVISQKYTFVSV